MSITYSLVCHRLLANLSMTAPLPAEDLPPHESPLFQGLPERAREALLAKTLIHRVPGGSVLLAQGEIPAFQHVLLSGAVHLFGRSGHAAEVLVEIVEPPDFVLPSAVATQSPCLTEARVLGPARFLLIEAETFRAAVNAEPALAKLVIESLSGQFRRMVRQIKTLKLKTANQRVGGYILDLLRKQGGDTVIFPHEKGLIASELGMTRESFSRALAALHDEGATCSGDVVTITDRGRLEALAQPDALVDGSPAGGG